MAGRLAALRLTQVLGYSTEECVPVGDQVPSSIGEPTLVADGLADT